MLRLVQKGKKGNHKASAMIKIAIKSQNMVKPMDQIKQQDVSKVNIQLSVSPQSEDFSKYTVNK